MSVIYTLHTEVKTLYPAMMYLLISPQYHPHSSKVLPLPTNTTLVDKQQGNKDMPSPLFHTYILLQQQ